MNELLNKISVFELNVLDFVVECFKNPVFDSIMPLISAVCNHGEIWILSALIMMCFNKTRKAGFTVIIALVFGLLVGNLTIKPLVARIRPYQLSGFPLLIQSPNDYSFPSGHTLASFESAFVIYFYNKKFGIYAFVLASLIAFSRLYLYVHYPTDVIAGIILGFLMAVVSKKLADKVKINLK